MKADIESNTNLITILHSDTKVNKDKIVFVEGELNEFKEKAVTKIKKNKVKFNDQLKKHSNRLNEIDNNIKGLYAMMLKVNKQVTVLEENKKRMDLENGVNNDLDRIESSNLFTQNENPFQLNFSNNQLEEFKEEFNKNLDKLVNTTKVQGDELDRIKKYLSAQKRTTDDDSSTNNTKQETRVLEYKIENEVKKEDLDEVKKIIKMFSDNETTLRDSISEKIKKEEIEMITKSFNVEIDKIVTI
jgi:septal ring factor EnvC (AmiA/AmiB activator)